MKPRVNDSGLAASGCSNASEFNPNPEALRELLVPIPDRDFRDVFRDARDLGDLALCPRVVREDRPYVDPHRDARRAPPLDTVIAPRLCLRSPAVPSSETT